MFAAEASLDSPAVLRRAVVLGALVTGLALGVACLAAWATKLPRKGQYSPTVWHSTLGLRRKEHLPYVVLELKDDERRVQGVLHSYTTLDGDHPRDIALMAPKVSVDGSTWEVGADYVVVSPKRSPRSGCALPTTPGRRESAADPCGAILRGAKSASPTSLRQSVLGRLLGSLIGRVPRIMIVLAVGIPGCVPRTELATTMRCSAPGSRTCVAPRPPPHTRSRRDPADPCQTGPDAAQAP
jgi:hypothetical protein